MRCSHFISCKVGSNVVDQGRRTGEAANCMDDPNRVVERCRWWVGNLRMILAAGSTMPNGGRRRHDTQIIAMSLR